MNRKKKRNAILKKRIKKAKAKLAPKSRSTYISKAERAKKELKEQGLLGDEPVGEETLKDIPTN